MVIPRSATPASGTRCTVGASMTASTDASGIAKRSAPNRKTRSRAPPSRNMVYHTNLLGDRRTNLGERRHTRGAGVRKRRLRQAEDRRAVAVLHDGATTRLSNYA